METKMEKARVRCPSDREVEVTRTFAAPRTLVYRAYTEPLLLQRWMLGPRGWTMPICQMDVRVGGRFRWRWRGEQDGAEFGFSGVFRIVEPYSRIVHTQIFEPGDPAASDSKESDGAAIVTLTFAQSGNFTTVTTLIDFGSKDARDAVMASGMTDGMEQSYQLLDRLLTEGRQATPVRATP